MYLIGNEEKNTTLLVSVLSGFSFVQNSFARVNLFWFGFVYLYFVWFGCYRLDFVRLGVCFIFVSILAF